MKISIFTPDHRGLEALKPCLKSVKEAAQYLNNTKAGSQIEIEWLVGWNGEAGDGNVLPEIPYVVVREIHLPQALNGKVGGLKRALCNIAEGDYLLELDSDDELMPAALVELAKGIELVAKDGEVLDFIYSDALRMREDNSDYLFAGNCGWARKDYFGHKYHPSPPMTAANLYTILHAPDHFRCWRREFYLEIGGHDIDYKICDDLDLLQRTYMAGANLLHLDMPLYKYNVKSDGSNTWLQNAPEIQRVSAALGDRNLVQLIEAESKRTGLPVLELGGAKDTPDRLTIAFSGADINHDLRFGIPLDGDSVTAVFAQDFLEHMEPCKGVDCRHFAGQCVVGIMEEIHRVLVPGGMLIANTPSTNGDGAWGDPSHKSGWNMWSVNYYTEANQAKFLGQHAGEPRCKFIRHRAYEWFPSEWHEDNNLKYLHFTLAALKPGVYGASTLR